MSGGEWAAWKTAHWLAIELQKSRLRRPFGLRLRALEDMLEQVSKASAEVLGQPVNVRVLGCRIDVALLALANEQDLLPVEATCMPLTYMHALCTHFDERFVGLPAATKVIQMISRVHLRGLEAQVIAEKRDAALSLGHKTTEVMTKRYRSSTK